ncbi:MAG: N-acetyltransferase [Gammaproteobacteria bacterium]|nr:N-acetyltransferase [Gammaproteobacteria bacterium]
MSMIANCLIRATRADDAEAIADIYNHYISNSIVTFEEQPVSIKDINSRILEATSGNLPHLVVEADKRVVGYAYASKWKGRCSYRYSVEVTVYLAPDAGGRGYGSKLYEMLFAELRERSYHVALAGISLPNDASIALHERFGMEKVAHMKEVGFKFGNWVDVGYWQVLLQ